MVVMTIVLLFLLCVVVEVHSQTYPFVRFGREDIDTSIVLSNHSYLDLTTVGTGASNRLECHTDLGTCCSSTQGVGRGDWFFPNGSVLQFSDSGDDIYQFHPRGGGGQRIFLRRWNNGVANGIYQCAIETLAVNNGDGRGIVYVGLYASGGEMYSIRKCF